MSVFDDFHDHSARAQAVRLIAWGIILEEAGFPQTNETLRKGGDGFCCLGVACEIAGAVTGNVERKRSTGYIVQFDDRSYGVESSTSLPAEVREWLGLVGAARPEAAVFLEHEIDTGLIREIRRKNLIYEEVPTEAGREITLLYAEANDAGRLTFEQIGSIAKAHGVHFARKHGLPEGAVGAEAAAFAKEATAKIEASPEFGPAASVNPA